MNYQVKLSDIIASLPEISGGFLYAQDKGILSNQTAGRIDDKSLQQTGLKLTEVVSMLSAHYHDTGDIRITFQNFVLFGTRIKNNQWMFLFHQPSLSPGMIKMTVQMALHVEQKEQKPEANDLKKALSPDSQLNIPLNTIHEELTLYIGPVADLVFHDSIELWNSKTTPSLEAIPSLIAILETEIDNKAHRTAFKNKMNTLV